MELTGRNIALFSWALTGNPTFLSAWNVDNIPAAETLAGWETLLAVGIMCVSVSRSVVADTSKHHYSHLDLEITAVIRPATRSHIIVVFLLTDSHVMQLAQAEPRRRTARRAESHGLT